MVCALTSLYAQSPPEIKPLSIGDTVPDITLYHVINYKETSFRLSNFKGIPVILDFFSTWCGSCIAALPSLNSLQEKFKDQVQIIVVTNQSSDKISSFLHHNPNVRNISLPFITDDSLLNHYFPHKLIPHQVWINKRGTVSAITEYYYVTAGNLQKLVDGKALHLPVKEDVLNFNRSLPLIEDYKNGNRPLYYSTFGKSIAGLPGSVMIQKDTNRVRILCTNMSIIDLYQTALPGLNNRIILHVQDFSRYIWNKTIPFDQWEKNNCFCYEVCLPPSTSDEKWHQYMMEDLNRYLGINGQMKNCEVHCWALIRTNDRKSISTKGGKPESDLLNESKIIKVFRNQPVSKLLSILNHQVPAYPLVPIIVDETHYSGNIDLILKVEDVHNIPRMQQALGHYGLNLIPVKRELEMLVLTENNFNAQYMSGSFKP